MTGLNSRNPLKVSLNDQRMAGEVSNETTIFCHSAIKCTSGKERDKGGVSPQTMGIQKNSEEEGERKSEIYTL